MFYIVSPIIKCEVPQTCSTTYKPLITSPLASGVVFPCSSVILAANLSMSLLMTAANSNMYLCLVRMGVVDHVLKASSAAFTAELNSVSVDKGVLAIKSCVTGLLTSNHSLV